MKENHANTGLVLAFILSHSSGAPAHQPIALNLDKRYFPEGGIRLQPQDGYSNAFNKRRWIMTRPLESRLADLGSKTLP